MVEISKTPTLCDKFIKWGLIALVLWLIYTFLMSRKETKVENQVTAYKEKLMQDLKGVRNRFMGKGNKSGTVYVPVNGKNVHIDLSESASDLVDDTTPLGQHVSELKTKGKRSLAPLPKYSRRFQLKGTKKALTKDFDTYSEQAEKLLPPQNSTAPLGSKMSECEAKWVAKAHLPSLVEIKEAQSIRQSSYFNELPIKRRRITDASRIMRAPLSIPEPPNLVFNQPVLD